MNNLIKSFPLSFRHRYRYQWRSLILEFKTIYAKIQRTISRPPYPHCDGFYLHLGCGMINHPKFINIDGLPHPHIHYVRAIDDLSPFKDKSVNLIYASHCLEHFSHIKVSEVLEEWFRVLKDDGILRISVPDFDLLLKIYQDNDNNIDTIVQPLMGGQDDKFNFHMTAFNFSSLEQLLKNSGFRLVRKWYPGTSEFTTFDDWSNRQIKVGEKEYSVSLNIEAIKWMKWQQL
jgi:predicted SAM-dependent methyltransferase